MKEEKKFIKFVEYKRDGAKTKYWAVDNILDNDQIGSVKWSTAWRRYVFHPYENTIFDSSCLKMLAEFCENETRKQKNR